MEPVRAPVLVEETWEIVRYVCAKCRCTSVAWWKDLRETNMEDDNKVAAMISVHRQLSSEPCLCAGMDLIAQAGASFVDVKLAKHDARRLRGCLVR